MNFVGYNWFFHFIKNNVNVVRYFAPNFQFHLISDLVEWTRDKIGRVLYFAIFETPSDYLSIQCTMCMFWKGYWLRNSVRVMLSNNVMLRTFRNFHHFGYAIEQFRMRNFNAFSNKISDLKTISMSNCLTEW